MQRQHDGWWTGRRQQQQHGAACWMDGMQHGHDVGRSHYTARPIPCTGAACASVFRPHPLTAQPSAGLRAPLQDQEAQVARKKRRNVTRAATRSVAGASLEVIKQKKSEKPEARKASREAALR